MHTVAIIQARMGSTRLPGKVMKTLCGTTVLGHVIHRVAACPGLDEVVVATTVGPEDDAIVQEAERHGAIAFRGSQDDVLERYYLAAKSRQADIVIRVTSDCPLFDPTVLSMLLDEFKASMENGVDYLSNTQDRSYPRGLDAEVFTFQSLERAFQQAARPYEREHVTPYLYQHPELFAVRQRRRDGADLSDLRWTLDTDDDWRLIEAVYSALGDGTRIFSTDSVLDLLQRQPELNDLNAHVRQKQLGE